MTGFEVLFGLALVGGAGYLYHRIKREKFALTCRRCQTLAYPISGTKNRYRCDRCGKQFAGARQGSNRRAGQLGGKGTRIIFCRPQPPRGAGVPCLAA